MKEKDFIEFAKIVGKLKKIPRTGWKERKVKSPESIADHSFRTALLGMVLSDSEKLDTEKIIRMLLLHDIEESIIGDIAAIYKVKMNKMDLKKKQMRAMKKVLSPLPKDLRNKYFLLWKEIEEEKTIEAKFCKDVDKLEMMIQAFEYELEDKKNIKKLRKFWEWEMNKPNRYPLTKRIYKKLENEKNENHKKRR
jgi:putative hydrolase of HD superfamily